LPSGSGIVHSERGLPAERDREKPIYGMQTWLALPDGKEEIGPAFEAVTDLPLVEDGCASARVIMGNLWGAAAPTTQHSPTIYAEITLAPGGAIPIDPEADERALMLIGGEASLDGQLLGLYELAVLAPGHSMRLASERGARVMLLGGAPLDSPRHVWWNFVSSSRDRINQAKDDWRAGKFGTVPGDEDEFIPLPQVPLTNSDTGREA
jgi:redox-sensitive bicupin YhaK (pirin superfamily)